MRRSNFSKFTRAAFRAVAALVLAAGMSGVLAAPASAWCANVKRSVYFVAFAEGSEALPPNLAAAFASHLAPDLGAGRYVDSYTILASGDLAEGADWDGAPTGTGRRPRRAPPTAGSARGAPPRSRR